MFDYNIAELPHKSQICSKTGAVTVYHGDVVKSDTTVPGYVQTASKQAICELEDTQDRDFHPGSDDKVVDLVHPSMYPLVYDRSRILKHEFVNLEGCFLKSGQGEVLPIPPDNGSINASFSSSEVHKPYSYKFQWLTCNVKLSDGHGCKITSYINNLRPQKFKGLYSIIEIIIDLAIPLWSLTLGHSYSARDLRIQYTRAEYIAAPEELRPERKPDENEKWGRVLEWEDANRITVQPEPPKAFLPRDRPQLDLRKEYKKHGLQVIVRLCQH
jgi:hypothetical protein